MSHVRDSMAVEPHLGLLRLGTEARLKQEIEMIYWRRDIAYKIEPHNRDERAKSLLKADPEWRLAKLSRLLKPGPDRP